MRYLVVALLMCLPLASCTKYADGPSFSFFTKKARITNTWKLESYTLNNSDYTPEAEIKLTLENDGTFSESTVVNALGQIQSSHRHGVWNFMEAKAQISMTESEVGALAINYEIRELKNARLKIRRTINNNVYVYCRIKYVYFIQSEDLPPLCVGNCYRFYPLQNCKIP